ncbi:GTP-binding protein [Candidatus Heimdallarchaeota archaeon]|nr:MAG: GTP-binding protein [Candidatus Heimdallarchaeota archaeon]
MPFKRETKSSTILFCGLSNAGKTTIHNIFTKGDIQKTSPTLGISISSFSFEDFKFRIFDMGGQENFQSEISDLLPFANLIVYVIDSADRERIDKSKKEFHRIINETQKSLTPICILCHKSDLKDVLSVEEITEIFEIEELFNRTWKIIESSAVTLEGLKGLFDWMYELTTGEKPKIKLEEKWDEDLGFFYPCPMLRKLESGGCYCLNQDGFEEVELISFGIEKEVSKMVMGIIPELREESLENSGLDVCPDFCYSKEGENVIRCPVTKLIIQTRGIIVSEKRYKDAVILSKIYGAKFGQDYCRECIYKIIISPDTLLSEEDLEEINFSYTE